MSRYNKTTARVQPRSPVTTEAVPSGRTYEGAPGYARSPESELFLLAVTHMGDGSFYETQPERDQRFRSLVHTVAAADPEWMAGFIPWLRGEANMRTASVVAAAETAKALLGAGKPGGRRVIASALRRADEPGELLAYWHSRYGRALPKPVKRGLADAITLMYDEYNLLKYDTASHGYRFADIIDLTHPAARAPWQGDLFKHALDRRHSHGNGIASSLTMLRANAKLRTDAAENPRVLLDSARLREAGMTWEDILSLAGDKLPKRELWTALIPSMGYMATLRNLRNFDDAGIPDDVAEAVAGRLADPAQVARSRQFPFRFLSAYRAAASLRWAYPLEKALGHSLSNVPALKGRTLVLVDRSPSMWQQRMSEHSKMPWADAAAVFGAAVALRAEYADLAEFGIENAPVKFSRSESVLKVVERFRQYVGTDIPAAVRRFYRSGYHDRVVIVTDEQTRSGYLPSNANGWTVEETAIDKLILRTVPVYIWNFGGYKHAAVPSGGENRHTFGGLSDPAFRMIPLLEAGRDAAWPWLTATAG